MNTKVKKTKSEEDYLIQTDIADSKNGGKKTESFDFAKRNILLLRFFKIIFPKNDIRIVGKEISPAVVIDFDYVLSCYTHYYELRFTNKNYKGDVLFTLELIDDVKKIVFDIDKIKDWHTISQHRKINKIYLESDSTKAPLYLIGWNFKNKITKEGKYPVFGEYEPKIYFTKEKTIEVQTELIQMGYNVIII